MASEIVHDVLDLELETLEAFIPETDWNCYPYPALRKTGRKATISIRTVTLSNAYLQATIALDLGGRLIQLFDRRTQKDILPPAANLKLTDDFWRGVRADFGVEINFGGSSRYNSLGPVEHHIVEPDGPDEPAKLILWESMTERSWQGTWTLFPDEAALEIEVVDFTRPTGTATGNSALGLSIFTPGAVYTAEQGLAILDEKAIGIGCFFEELTFDALEEMPGGIALDRGAIERALVHEPCTADSWRAKIVPFSLGGKPLALSPLASIGVDGDELIIQATRQLSGAKVFVSTATGPVEAPVDLDPGQLCRLDLSVLAQPSEILLRDSTKNTLLGSNFTTLEPSPPEFPYPQYPYSEEHQAKIDVRSPGSRAFGHFKLAQIANRNLNPMAAQHIENCLNTNAENAVAWWFKAALERHDPAFNPEEERTALLNAHFISPMEPMLRAEAVLSTPEGNPEPSPLMKPLLQNPESLTDAVCLLIECGFKADATRLIHEALKHENILILRVLLASILLKDTKLEFDVADQLREAAKVQPRPPYPWRTTEFEAIRDLLARFPNDPVLKDLKQMIHQGTETLIGE
jgi:hypothetical protein